MTKFKKNLSTQERFKAFESVFDQSTFRALHKLSCRGYFDELKGAIKVGKEANVYIATKKKDLVAVKIYRKSANFKKMYEYMAPDPRFSGLKRNKMEVIETWSKKEFRNLLKAKEAGIKVPLPHVAYKNVLVMEYIGDKEPAKQINKKKPIKPKEFYETLIKYVKTLYYDAKLVHADLSEFNILIYNEMPVVIDFSHAVGIKYPNVKTLLKRDVENLVRYFNKFGLKLNVQEEYEKCINKN